MDESERCHAEYSIQKWCSLLGLKQKKLISFLELTEKQLKTKIVYSENIIRIEIPNLLKKRDNYTKHLQAPKKPLVSKDIEVEVDKEVDKKEPKTFLPDSEEIRLVDYFISQIKMNKADFKNPNKQSWAKDFDLMIRRDKRQYQEIVDLIKWCQKDSFEMTNVLCPDKLRKRYDQLIMKMKQPQGGQRGINSGFKPAPEGKYAHLDK